MKHSEKDGNTSGRRCSICYQARRGRTTYAWNIAISCSGTKHARELSEATLFRPCSAVKKEVDIAAHDLYLLVQIFGRTLDVCRQHASIDTFNTVSSVIWKKKHVTYTFFAALKSYAWEATIIASDGLIWRSSRALVYIPKSGYRGRKGTKEEGYTLRSFALMTWK